MHDLVIRRGTVVDGSGAPARAADIAIDDDRIAEVVDRDDGGSAGPGRREIDATDLLVTPGWVDVHTHYDAQATWDPYLTPSGFHGVTTVVMGNCGVGFAPVAPDRRDWLIGLMEGVEDIPGAAMADGIEWEWEDFEGYLDALDRRRYVCDVGAQIPHGALRTYVMGERGAANEPATADDIARMAAMVESGLRAGALGFSTSRTPIHKSVDGELVPGTTAGTDEILGIGEAIRRVGHGVFEYSPDHVKVGDEFGWMRDLAALTGQPVSFNLNQPDTDPDYWQTSLRLLEEAASDGLPVVAQVAGRAIGILFAFELTLHPFLFKPAWGEMAFLEPAEKQARFQDPAWRQRFLDEEPIALGGDFARFVTTTWERMFPFQGDSSYEPGYEDSVAGIAEATGRRPEEVAYDHLARDGGTGMLYFPLFNYAYGDLELTRQLQLHPQTRMGLSDGGAHCGAVCDGGMPTFMLSYWARDRTQGSGTMPLEHVVHRQTRQTAEMYGLLDRGLLAPGMRADVNVIDHATLGVHAPEIVHDLPSGARRLLQRAHGYRHTICAGEVTVTDDQFTGELPGRLLRGPRSSA
ncbi:amidohydrolase family protein [Acidimicrobiia bacterium EGI L10123]|uniref:N-acyl-D-amino-acid deacylase family protein n=1 Tax=Salinilacustrithrix flava TaxID=2957203 RepID=UPI003D7C31CC|nr:amidohydrolase family protein [Acidimicrobiia bacterium EGI L10123]